VAEVYSDCRLVVPEGAVSYSPIAMMMMMIYVVTAVLTAKRSVVNLIDTVS